MPMSCGTLKMSFDPAPADGAEYLVTAPQRRRGPTAGTDG